MYKSRREKLLLYMKEKNIDSVVFVPGATMYYFTGLQLNQSERLTLAILKKDGNLTFIAPKLEFGKVQAIADGAIFSYSDEQGPMKAITEWKEHEGELGCVGVEYGHMRIMELKAVESIGYKSHVDISEGIHQLRMIKDQGEVSLMRKAVKIVEEALEATLPLIKPGVNELDIAAHLEYEMRRRGSEGTPFGTIVASGYRGALPHGRAADKVIEDGEVVVLDFGAVYKGYVADITRTVAIGKISDDFKKIYRIVKEAIEAAIEAVKPGIKIHDIDETARNIIRQAGYGDYFTHRLGHGIGLNVHEEPYIMQNNKQTLQPGMSFTIEPGVYLPGKGGVRIEDNLIVTEEGYINLMSFTKELIVL